MTMTKKQLAYIRDLKKKIGADSAKRTRAYKKNEFEKAMAKDKVETHGDIYGIFCGLSKRAMEISALHRIETLAAMGYSPKKIIELMEPKKEKKEES
jgi:hypothetical protein